MTLILHAPIIYISVERGFDNVVVELGIVGLILWVEMGLSSPISPWKVAKKVKATPWFPLASVPISVYALSPGDFPELLCPPGLCYQGLR